MTEPARILVSFNEQNQDFKPILDSFRDDLSYCLKRLRVDSRFVNGEDGSYDFRLVIVGTNDFSSPKFIETCNLSTVQPNTFVVLYEPIPVVGNALALAIHRFQCFMLWDQVAETGEIRFYRKDVQRTKAAYWERITDIALEISDRMGKGKKVRRGKVYLAQTESLQQADRDNLRRDLQDLGYEVAPSTLLSVNYDECCNQINEAVEGCDLIIHPVPPVYSAYFPDRAISIVEHQSNLSARYISDAQRAVKRIVWIPSEYEVVDEENQIFIEKIQRDQDQSHNSIILKVNLEDLKKIYRKILAGEEIKQEANAQLPDVYVIADDQEKIVADAMRREAQDAGLKVGVNFKGISYNQHLRYLANAQVVVINYTTENLPWINVKVTDILKSPGLDTSKPNKKLILIKGSKELNTEPFEEYFNEIHVVEANELKLNVV
jgi:hypothetical protein